ncbi:hypothetical protein [Psychrobacillus sp. NPDC096623]|uniref:hypothetical protein n=1 Tax=Psychrobacillus sp. NPDC096623 TaxID=3364492 RepID=UPI00380CC8B7
MKKKCAIIGTDARLPFVKETLDNLLEVKIFPTMIWTEELKAAINDFHPTIIFLPIPPLKIDCSFVLPNSCLLLFVGKKNSEIEQEIQNSQVHAFNYLEDEQWIWENANLTAEGFINYFYRNENESIYNKKFIITGYGRVGKRLAFALHHLGAEVIISVRSDHQLFEAKSYGYQIEQLEHVDKIRDAQSTYLINTIPYRWLSPSDTNRFIKVYDLASNPGCLLESANSTPTNYIHSTSLPGLFFPKDAGYLIAKTVQTQLALLEGEE